MPAVPSPSVPAPLPPDRVAMLHARVLRWYAGHARDLPWRRHDCTPWGVFVSEIMAQQTPLARVEPVWREWLDRWPTPAALTDATVGDVVRAWGRLGYPRRAVRLRQAALIMVDRHGGEVPDTQEALRALPGVGGYTAAAVAAFAHGEHAVVVDTNVRRVLTRVLLGRAQADRSVTAAEVALAQAVVPAERADSVTWNVAVMELGALVCRARTPRCVGCPVADLCAWARAGHPRQDGPPRRGQGYLGTDRKVRGDLLQLLRDSAEPVSHRVLHDVDADPVRVERCLEGLVSDGLVECVPGGLVRLPATR